MIKKQHGVTLIELMVSMMLGLALISGLSQLFVQSQKSFKLQRNLSDMTDDGVFVLDALAKGLRQAGYSEDGTKNYPSSANSAFPIPGSPVVPNIIFNDSSEYIHGADEVSSSGKGDQLVYRYKLSNVNELSNSMCTDTKKLKDAYAVGKIVTVRIYKKYDGDFFVFYCKSSVDSIIEDAQPLISQVEKLVFKYGVKISTVTATCSTPPCFYYTNADGVSSDWTKVFAVKVFLVMRSADKNLTRFKTGWSIDGGETEYPATDEKRLYKVFSKTIFLRNAP